MGPDRTALLVMDVQAGIVQRLGDPELLDRLARAIAAAREAGVLVIFVGVAFRAGHPEISPRNSMFSAVAARGAMVAGPATEVHDAVAPRDGDITLTKLRVSAFSGSPLEVILRARGVESLVLSGIATSGVVLSTVREAADRDFDLIVLKDGCADPDAEVHRVLTEKLFPRQAAVTSVADWVGSL